MTQESTSQDKAAMWAELDAIDSGAAAAPATEPVQQPQEAAQPADQVQAASAAQAAAPEAAAQGEAAKQDDPYAGLPDAVKHELMGMKHQLEQANQRLRNAEGRIGGLNSQLQQYQQAAQATRSGGGSAPSASQIREAQGSAEAMKKLAEDYPEFGAAIQGALDEQAATLRQELARLQPQQGEQPAVTAQDLEVMRRKLTVEAKHPGWEKTVATPGFQGWLYSQPREVQMLAASDHPEDAIRLFDLHADATKRGSAQTTQRLASAAALPQGRATSVRVKPVEEMTKQEYWAYLDSIDKQKAA